jgi:ATP-dependent exoDNAse (exonuclease V) beta subunit
MRVKPADIVVRERALDPHTSFIVQAPAGSGKTELLIRRFLVLLARVKYPEEVVAITFTRKAAAEMRERVLEALKLAQQPSPHNEYEQELWQIAQQAWSNNQARDWQLEQHPARLRIQTIDSLCATLTGQMPWLSRSGAPLSVLDDASEQYRDAALRTVLLLGDTQRSWSAAVATLLAHLDNRIARAVELIIEMLRHRDQWLRHIGGAVESEPDSWRRSLETAWENVVARELSTLRNTVPEDVAQDLVACAVYAAEPLTQSQPAAPIAGWRGRRKLPDAAVTDLPAWRGLAELLLRKDDGWRQRVDKRNGFPADKSPQAQTMRQRMHDLLQALSAEEAFHHALINVRRLPDSRFTEDQWRIVSALTRLLPVAVAQLDVLFAERGRVDFTELNRRANLALGDLDDPTDLALVLDYRIQHLLVDEFQDTSLTQFDLLQRLTAGWQPGDGRTLFLVGDPMQSIYRFREAEVGLFPQVVEQGLGSVRIEPLTLAANFRSDPSIVDWVNRCFYHDPPTPSELRRGAVTFAQSDAVVAPVANSGVTIHPLLDQDREAEAQRVVEVVAQTRRERVDASVAVLVRSRAQLQDILSLTQALLNPADRMAWLAILRAPWCGLTLQDLFSLVADNAENCVWDQLQSQRVLTGLSADGQQRAARLVAAIAASLANRGRGALREWVASTWEQLGGPACISADDLAYADKFFALLGDHDAGGRIANLPAFQRALHDTWVRPELDPDAKLHIMTVHKAKGLEFDTVIIPGLQRTPRREESKLLLWEEDATPSEKSLLLAPLSETGSTADPHYDYLRRLRTDKDAFEVGRLLYVGCTRARHSLHLIAAVDTLPDGRLRTPRSPSFVGRLWHVIQEEFEAARGQYLASFESAETAPGPRALHRLPAEWRIPEPMATAVAAQPAPIFEIGADIEFSWVGETMRHIGILVHEYLQQLSTQENLALRGVSLERQRSRWRKALVGRGVSENELERCLTQLEEVVRHVAEDPRGQWLFDSAHRDVHSEYALSSVVNGSVRHVRIDRTFIDRHGVRWIVDFKTSSHRGGSMDEFLDREVERYRPQLECYARMVKAMEDREIRLGLYFPLLKRWREWPYAAA